MKANAFATIIANMRGRLPAPGGAYGLEAASRRAGYTEVAQDIQFAGEIRRGTAAEVAFAAIHDTAPVMPLMPFAMRVIPLIPAAFGTWPKA